MNDKEQLTVPRQYFLLPLYKSYRTLRTLFGAKNEIVQISRDYRDNFEICK